MMLEHFCKKCGKVFIPAPQHVYKDEKGFYCSWTCYNHKDDGKPKRKMKAVRQYDEMGRPLREYESAKEASECTGYNIVSIREACLNGKAYYGYYWKYQD